VTRTVETLPTERERARRRAVPVLVGSQVLGGVGVASGIAVGGLLAEQVSGSTALSGLAQTATVLGSAALAVPLARLAAARGRRPALATGYGLGLLGTGLVVVAAVLGSFVLLVAGLLLFGGATTSGLQARYAATDAATPETRGRSLSVVVWATTAGAVAGPNLSGLGGRLGEALGLPSLAGPYLFSAVSFAAGALVVGLLLRPDPLVVAGPGAPTGPRPSVRETLRVVLAVPAARLGLVAVATAHAVMVGVMVMTPVHLGHGGASLQVVGIVISVHIAGMYAASPVMGWLADRAGRVATIGLGVGLLAAALVVGALAPAEARGWVTVSMLLLGLGWSAALVAGSTLLSESVPAEVRTSVQGTSDLVMGLAGAGAGALAGPVLAAGGYPSVAVAAAVLLVPVVVLLARRRDPGAGRGVRPRT
ncbi:Major facilitator superfamily protein, partial [Klenkia terrae]